MPRADPSCRSYDNALLRSPVLYKFLSQHVQSSQFPDTRRWNFLTSSISTSWFSQLSFFLFTFSFLQRDFLKRDKNTASHFRSRFVKTTLICKTRASDVKENLKGAREIFHPLFIWGCYAKLLAGWPWTWKP